ncbi:MAG TPA: T9SS type A sorting domain-containing protein, partial [Saprospiraceae bacterium]|nr:T9SS type A sorting domain-containing protein [Saprospiraceae bacterium]
GTIFTDVTGLSTGADQITIAGSVLNLKLAARSYAVWVEGDNPIIPLPLNILSFEAQKLDKNVQLTASMTSLENIKTIIIQKSADERIFSDWKTLEFDSKQAQVSFQLLDEKPALKNYYRIKSVENDGAVNFSPVKTVFFSGSGIRLVNNLVDNELIFEGNIEKEFNYFISDIYGRIISTQKIRGNTINIQRLISGIYFIQIDGQEVFRFVKK